jgi:hypothetical protein
MNDSVEACIISCIRIVLTDRKYDKCQQHSTIEQMNDSVEACMTLYLRIVITDRKYEEWEKRQIFQSIIDTVLQINPL